LRASGLLRAAASPSSRARRGCALQELGLTIEQPFAKQLRIDVLIASIIGDVREALLESGSLPADLDDEPLTTADLRLRLTILSESDVLALNEEE
jgi:hypothetical protein